MHSCTVAHPVIYIATEYWNSPEYTIKKNEFKNLKHSVWIKIRRNPKNRKCRATCEIIDNILFIIKYNKYVNKDYWINDLKLTLRHGTMNFDDNKCIQYINWIILISKQWVFKV